MSRKPELVFRKGQILYGQGSWRVRVVADDGSGMLAYVALEGGGLGYDGRTLCASRDLFSVKRYREWPRDEERVQ